MKSQVARITRKQHDAIVERLTKIEERMQMVEFAAGSANWAAKRANSDAQGLAETVQKMATMADNVERLLTVVKKGRRR